MGQKLRVAMVEKHGSPKDKIKDWYFPQGLEHNLTNVASRGFYSYVWIQSWPFWFIIQTIENTQGKIFYRPLKFSWCAFQTVENPHHR